MRDENCKRCALHEGAINVCVVGDGTPHPIMLFGEAPGENEDKQGKPFIGDAGQLLTKLLEQAGLDRSDVYITNVVRCRPPGNRAPHVAEINACRLFTVRELSYVQPRAIIALGATSLKALTGHATIGRSRGKPLPLLPEYRSEVPVIGTYHPAAALHNPARREAIFADIISDLRLAKRYIDGDTAKYETVIAGKDPEETAKAIGFLASCEELACDLEWEVLNDTERGTFPWTRRGGRSPKLVSIGLAGRIADGTLLGVAIKADSEWAPAFRQLINNIPTVYHLGLETTDLCWLLATNHRPIVGGDTYTLAKALNVNAADFSLATLAGLFTDFDIGWKESVRTKRGRKKLSNDDLLGSVPQTEDEWDTLLEYNAKDCIATLLLHENLIKYGEDQGRDQLIDFYREILAPNLLTFAEMAINGLPLDEELLRLAEIDGRRRIEMLRRDIGQMLGMGDRWDMVDSPQKIATLIERNLEIPLPRTKTGKPSLSEDVRLRLMNTHPIFEKLSALATVVKRHGTYFEPWKRLLELQGDGRLHTVYRPSGTVTGRTSAMAEDGGTLQQFPRGKEIRKLVRARDGWKLIIADLSQIELRVGAVLSGDERLLNYYKEGKDVHRMTAAFVKAFFAGRTLDQFLAEEDEWSARVVSDDRQAAKPVNFGFLYGAHEQTFIDTAKSDYGMDFTMQEATLLRDAYFNLYPGILRWHNRALNDIARGGVGTFFGRWRDLSSLEEEEHELIRKAVNTPTQAIGNDMAFCGMRNIALEVIKGGYTDVALFVGYVHDSVMLEVRDDVLHDLARITKYGMEHPPFERLNIDFPIPIEAEVKVGQTWGEAEVYEVA